MSNVATLDRDAKALHRTLDRSIVSARKADNRLSYIEGKLAIPEKIAADLQGLVEDMRTVKAMLTTASVVPQIRRPAKTMIAGINRIQKPIADARKRVKAFDKRIKPVRDRVSKTRRELNAKIINPVERFQAKVATGAENFRTAERSVARLPDGSPKTRLAKRVEQAADGADTCVVELDAALATIIDRVNKTEQLVRARIDPALKPLDDLDRAIHDLERKLNRMSAPLRSIQNELNKSVVVPFPYPCPTWTKPHKVCTYRLRIGMMIVVQGVDSIQTTIERTLGSVLWAAAKAVGIKKLVKRFLSKGNRTMNRLLKRLKLDFSVRLPGLGQLQNRLDGLKSSATVVLDALVVDVTPVKRGMSALDAKFRQADRILVACREVT